MKVVYLQSISKPKTVNIYMAEHITSVHAPTSRPQEHWVRVSVNSAHQYPDVSTWILKELPGNVMESTESPSV